MRHLALAEVLHLHRLILVASGGGTGIRDLNGLESALAQPQQTFDGRELYPSLTEKAAALCFSLVSNHPFVDGNKRVAHAAMEVFLQLNGLEIAASIEAQERLMLGLAAGTLDRAQLLAWLDQHVTPLPPGP